MSAFIRVLLLFCSRSDVITQSKATLKGFQPWIRGSVIVGQVLANPKAKDGSDSSLLFGVSSILFTFVDGMQPHFF